MNPPHVREAGPGPVTAHERWVTVGPRLSARPAPGRRFKKTQRNIFAALGLAGSSWIQHKVA